MPTYRLLTGFATIVETFDAAGDPAARTVARKLACEFPRCERQLEGRADFRVERREGDSWKYVFGWIPGH